MPEWLIDVLITLAKIVVVEGVILTAVAYSVYAERRVSAFTQNILARVINTSISHSGII